MLLRVLLVAAIATAVLPARSVGAAPAPARVDPCAVVAVGRTGVGDHPGNPLALEVLGAHLTACAATYASRAPGCHASLEAGDAYAAAARLRAATDPDGSAVVVDWVLAYEQYTQASALCDAVAATRATRAALDALRRFHPAAAS